MAIDISTNTHVISFPSYVASMMGQYGHILNLVMQANSEQGTIYAKGDYVSFEQYEADAVTDNAIEGEIIEFTSEGLWLVEITKLPAAPVYYSYNSPISPYSEAEFRDEKLFFNKTGDVTQGAELHLGDKISYSDAAFSTLDPEVGKAVKYASKKWAVQA